MTHLSRRLGSALVLAATLTAAPALAREHATKQTRSYAPVGAVQHALAVAWNRFASLWAATGSRIDPFGGATASTPTTPTPQQLAGDTGSGIDPFGGH